MKFKFNFGNKKPDIKTYAIIGVVLTSIIAFLSNCTGIKEELIWDFFDEVQREVNPSTPINDFIIKDPKKLERRINRDIDRAIEKVTPEYDRIIKEANKKYEPKYIEEPINNDTCYTEECKSLGGPIRMCAPWVEDCK
jgi:hypothetical protein